MDVNELVRRWLEHLAVERGLSANTLSNYRRDLRRYASWLHANGKANLSEVTAADIEAYLADLRRGVDGAAPLAASSAARALVVARGLHKFGVLEGVLAGDESAQVAPPSPGKKLSLIHI